jgi:hypothetical protein
MPTAHVQLPHHIAFVGALVPSPQPDKTKDTLVIDFSTLTAQQGVNAQIAKTWT